MAVPGVPASSGIEVLIIKSHICSLLHFKLHHFCFSGFPLEIVDWHHTVCVQLWSSGFRGEVFLQLLQVIHNASEREDSTGVSKMAC